MNLHDIVVLRFVYAKQYVAYFCSILSQILVDQPTYTCSKQVGGLYNVQTTL